MSGLRPAPCQPAPSCAPPTARPSGRGPAAAPADRANGGGAIIEIPADRLRVDDYVIVLFATGPGGGEVEQARYVLRVRAR